MPSKSARKRESLALQAMGEQLIRLRESELDQVPLEEPLRLAVGEAQRMRSRAALRRQRQLIGKLMREADADAIASSLDAIGRRDRLATEAFHAAEEWRDRIAREGTAALAAFAARTGRPSTTLAALLRELRAARSEKAERAVRRRMFRAVRDELAASRRPEETTPGDGAER